MDDSPIALSGAMTLDEYLDWWLANQVNVYLSPVSRKTYPSALRHYARPALGGRPLASITTADVQRMVDDIVADGRIMATTVRMRHSVLRGAMQWALQHGLIERNPCLKVKLPRREPRRVVYLDADEARAFVVAALAARPANRTSHDAREWYRFAILVQLASGLRVSELTALTWDDVDLDVPDPSGGVGAELRVTAGKSASARRAVRVPPVARLWLVLQREAVERRRARAPRTFVDRGLVFPSTLGTRANADQIVVVLKRIVRASGVAVQAERYGTHMLRHSWVTSLLEGGEDLYVVSKLAGHARVSTTIDVYGHVTGAAASHAAGIVGDRLTSRERSV